MIFLVKSVVIMNINHFSPETPCIVQSAAGNNYCHHHKIYLLDKITRHTTGLQILNNWHEWSLFQSVRHSGGRLATSLWPLFLALLAQTVGIPVSGIREVNWQQRLWPLFLTFCSPCFFPLSSTFFTKEIIKSKILFNQSCLEGPII